MHIMHIIHENVNTLHCKIKSLLNCRHFSQHLSDLVQGLSCAIWKLIWHQNNCLAGNCKLSVCLTIYSFWYRGLKCYVLLNTQQGYDQDPIYLYQDLIFYTVYILLKQDYCTRRLQVQTLSDATPPIGKIHQFSIIAVTFEPMMQFWYILRFRMP